MMPSSPLPLTSLLLAVDGSPFAERAVRYAAFLSQRLGLPLRALNVLDIRLATTPGVIESGLGDVSPLVPEFDSGVQQVLEARAQEIKTETDALLKHLGSEAELELTTGLPAEVILDAAKDDTLLVLGKRGEGAELGRAPGLGAIAERVVRRAEGAVLLVPQTFEPPQRLLLGYDGSEGAQEALGYAWTLAQRLELPVLALSVHDDEAQAQGQLEEVRELAAREGLKLETQALSGDPAKAILSATKPGDIIAIGAFGAGRVAEFFRGSTTGHIVRGAEVPVLLHS